MEETNESSLNLNNDENRHVFSMLGKKPSKGALDYLWVLVGAFIGLFVYGLTFEEIDNDGFALLIALGIAVILSFLFVALAKKCRKRAYTNIIVEQKGITFLRRNGETTFYPIEAFINLKVTRHYYNGAYTGSTHSLLFKNMKGKQDEIQLGSMDKDLISTMFDDINSMKQYGHFFVPEAQPAFINTPATMQNQGNIISDSSTENTNIQEQPQVDSRFPYGYSDIDGKSYTHNADFAISEKNSRTKRYLIIMIIGIVLTLFSAAVTLTIDKTDFSTLFLGAAIIFGVVAFVAMFLMIINVSNGSTTCKNMIKKVEFYSNCVVFTTTSGKFVLDIPFISRIFVTTPDRANPSGLRTVKILTNNNGKVEVNMGKLKSRHGYEVFGYYKEFFFDLHNWAANHGVICVNDISQ